MKITDTHIYFYKSWLSNWTPSNLDIQYDHHNFTNSEQIFMYLKAKFFNDNEIASEIVLSGSNPKIAKDLGRQVKNFNNEQWSKVREEKMFIANLLKFRSSKYLAEKLIETEDKILVEASPIDPIWGVMLSEDDERILDEKNWKGQNLLGKTLMKVRDKIKIEIQYNGF